MKLLSLIRGGRSDAPALIPREVAIELLSDALDAGYAGLDPYDSSVFLLDVAERDRLWAHKTLTLVGHVIGFGPHGNKTRFRAIVEADVRYALALDCGAPTLDDEPLASRGVDAITKGVEAMASLERAHTAYDIRYPNGITEVH